MAFEWQVYLYFAVRATTDRFTAEMDMQVGPGRHCHEDLSKRRTHAMWVVDGCKPVGEGEYEVDEEETTEGVRLTPLKYSVFTSGLPITSILTVRSG